MSNEKKPAPRVPPIPRSPAAPRISSQSTPSAEEPAATAPIEDWLAYVREKVESVKFGSLQIVVHDGRITQVESTEKFRLQPPPRTP